MTKDSRIPILFLHSSADLYGSDKSLLRIVGALDRRRFAPVVFLPCDGPLAALVAQTGVPVHVLPLGIFRRRHANVAGIIRLFFENIAAVIRVAWFVRRHHIAIVQSNTLAVVAGGIAARLAGVPHVWTVREIVQSSPRTVRLLQFLMRHCADKILPVSRAAATYWAADAPGLSEKMEVVTNGVEMLECGISSVKARMRLGVPEDGVWVGLMGRINRVKGHTMLLEIARSLAEKIPAAHFVCMGGPLPHELWRKKELEQVIAQEGLQKRFFLVDFRRDVETFYRAVDVVVVPSVMADAFPTVCIEAGLFERPVVAFDEGGIGEIVRDGETGFCVPHGDIGEFRRRLEQLLQDAALRESMGRLARDHCRQKFSLAGQMVKLERIYLAMAGRRA